MKEKALLIGIRRPGSTVSEMEASLSELIRLVDTSGGVVAGIAKQELKTINPATFLGTGKVENIKINIGDAQMIVVDDELTPAQNRNLSEAFGIKVLDRTAVILDIFARRARTREGELQVELAQLNYRASRLTGRGLSFSQQAGYIGNRGPGETKLEVDRRRIRERISFLRGELKKVRMHRELHRRKRENVPIPVVSLIGYTNSGKSTLMNALTSANVLVEDKLFATLDPTVRRMRLKSGRIILVADTVGFIRKLPHQLVESFRATFEEVENSDLLVHVIDASDSMCARHVEVVDAVLGELGLSDKPCLKVFNKCDCKNIYVKDGKDGVFISASKKTGMDGLAKKLDDMLVIGFKHARLNLPHSNGAILSEIYRVGRVNFVKHGKQSIAVNAELPEKLVGRYKKYSI
ncbi:MAG: GTPase HflX [Deltaproteobacteria bacterium]|nr:GTPase HflX [Deltaproteobacteria bacterium]